MAQYLSPGCGYNRTRIFATCTRMIKFSKTLTNLSQTFSESLEQFLNRYRMFIIRTYSSEFNATMTPSKCIILICSSPLTKNETGNQKSWLSFLSSFFLLAQLQISQKLQLINLSCPCSKYPLSCSSYTPETNIEPSDHSYISVPVHINDLFAIL